MNELNTPPMQLQVPTLRCGICGKCEFNIFYAWRHGMYGMGVRCLGCCTLGFYPHHVIAQPPPNMVLMIPDQLEEYDPNKHTPEFLEKQSAAAKQNDALDALTSKSPEGKVIPFDPKKVN